MSHEGAVGFDVSCPCTKRGGRYSLLQAGAYRLIEMLRACARVFATS